MLGTAVFGGMIAASLIAIFIIPVSFYIVERLAHRGVAATPTSQPETGAAQAGAH